ncbi:MAG: zf-TFIIB domain-containing protein [Actinomycetota bacterium]|nr:zf-TFIIB domain-containing protein [Actinomycetota bacterium]
MRCPVCESSDLAISSREGVEIDYCPQCRGVWLDRGELDKIIDRAGPAAGGGRDEPARQERSDREPARGDDRYDKRKKRRSFLEEIFDFD